MFLWRKEREVGDNDVELGCFISGTMNGVDDVLDVLKEYHDSEWYGYLR